MSEQDIEKEIQAKGLNAPRLTPQGIDELIISKHFIAQSANLADGSCVLPISETALDCLTICVLVLKNGFTVVGKSACASPANFYAELGRRIAFEDARRQIWALAGYELKSRLAEPVN